MKSKQESTQLTKEEALADRKWFLLDAQGKTLGRFAAEVAKILRGKHKPNFTPHVDCGDGVIIINADKIQVTGNKEAQKIYRYYTGAIGGLREVPYQVMMERKPEEILRRAISGMMPNSRLGKQQVKKLRIFAGNKHHLQAQQPIAVTV
jgi:large subunit ribosomal protein L13